MGKVTINIHNRDYDIACDDGQEQMVEKLGQSIHARVNKLAGAMHGISDSKLLILTLLTMAAEMEDIKNENQKLQIMSRGKEAAESEIKLAGILDQLASRIENMAVSLEN